MSDLQFSPQLSLTAQDAGDKRLYRASFYMGRGAGYTVQCKSVAIDCLRDDALSVGVRRAEGSADSTRYVVSIDVAGASHEIATVAVTGDAQAMAELPDMLQDEMQRELFRVMGGLVPVVAAPVVQAATGAGVVVKSATPALILWKAAVVTLVVLALGIMGYGLTRQKSATPNDPDQLAQADFSDLQKRIRAEITEAAKSGKPAINNANISNISIETMRAMGLDPGKANAGCLVGVQK